MAREYMDYVVAKAEQAKEACLFELPAWRGVKKGDYILLNGTEFKALADGASYLPGSSMVKVLRQLYGNPLRATAYMPAYELDYSEYDQVEEGEETE